MKRFNLEQWLIVAVFILTQALWALAADYTASKKIDGLADVSAVDTTSTKIPAQDMNDTDKIGYITIQSIIDLAWTDITAGDIPDISGTYQTKLTNEAGLYGALSDVADFVQTEEINTLAELESVANGGAFMSDLLAAVDQPNAQLILGLVPGDDVQAQDDDLAYLAGFTPTADVKAILNAANDAEIKGYLDTDDIQTALGISAGATHMGDYDETIITSSQTVKQNIQELETYIVDNIEANYIEIADPNADKPVFWDDSEGAPGLLTIGAGLNITTTTISADMTLAEVLASGADANDVNITSGADIACDSISPDGATVEIGDSDEETHIQADGVPDSDDTYSCGMVVWLTAGNAVKQWDLVMMQADGKVDMANASGYPIGFAVEESNDGWPAADTESIGVCLIGSGGVIRNDGWTTFTAGNIVYVVDAGGTDGLFDTAGNIDLEDGDHWVPVGVMQEEDVIIFPVPAWATDDGT
jgi:hypothetical protein